MKNKAKLAFELLEQEMEVIYKEDLMQFIGGSGYSSSGGYGSGPLPNGYCLFNAMAYIFDGTTANAQSYVNYYEANNVEVKKYDSDGNFTGYAMSGNQAYNAISAGLGGFGAVNFVSSGSYGNSMFNGGARILAFLNNVGPAGEQHAVEIKSMNSNGTFNYYDPTTGQQINSSNAQIGNMFSIQCQ